MNKGKLGLVWRATAIVSISALIVAAIIRRGIHTSAQGGSGDFGSQMIRLVKQGRFDDAIQVGLHSLQNDPSDELVYQQIADTYLVRASKDADQRQQWLAKAVSYIDKSLSLNSKDRDAAGVHLLQDALGLETVGSLSQTSRCIYYDRARKLLEDRVSLLQGDHLLLDGKTYPLAPLREENEKRLAEVLANRAKAGCE
ncbi:MAG TPA: hypothetical protein VIX91_05430 [Candidatus Acidoferrum sp.]